MCVVSTHVCVGLCVEPSRSARKICAHVVHRSYPWITQSVAHVNRGQSIQRKGSSNDHKTQIEELHGL